MRFIDEVTLTLSGGAGGDGCSSFRREKYIPFGGPDGGDGGRGGSLFLEATSRLTTLADYRYKKHVEAASGEAGGPACCTGASGVDLILPLPLGTKCFEVKSGMLLADLCQEGERYKIASGGRPGLGNVRFKSSCNRAPRHRTLGEKPEPISVRLELNVLAEVGLLGLPNAGKSTLLRLITSARPKVADYPFTTLKPHLGVVQPAKGESFVVADLPGLIEGASRGVGLGLKFLKHLSRCNFLVHLLDGSGELKQMLRDEAVLLEELKNFGSQLTKRSKILVISKCDLISEEEAAFKVEQMSEIKKHDPALLGVVALSFFDHKAVERFAFQLSSAVQKLRLEARERAEADQANGLKAEEGESLLP